MPKEKSLLDVLWKWASKSPIPAKSADAALASGRVKRHHRSIIKIFFEDRKKAKQTPSRLASPDAKRNSLFWIFKSIEWKRLFHNCQDHETTVLTPANVLN
ncbi:hypothetical protein QS257_18280 [Terrilactibacillus sp. S3-3]|nr:hypothetical protein QS257_18280 [Terrilactibacillus sp. S3-3]